MKEKLLYTVLQMTVCPGEHEHHHEDSACRMCPHMGKIGCVKALKADALMLLQAYRHSNKDKSVELHTRVSEVLCELGIPAHLNGYRYLRSALVRAVQDQKVEEGIVKGLYVDVAKEFNTTPSRVERSIRHAVEVAWDRCDLDQIYKWFGGTVSPHKGRPTNSEFICMVADKIRLERGM